MAELVVHRLEEILVQQLDIVHVKLVGSVEGDLQSALGLSESLGSRHGVVRL